MKDLDKLSKDELHGILTAYEMRTDQGNPSKGEAAFKTTKKSGKPKLKPCSNCKEVSEDEEEANFTKRLQRGTGKYKGKLPFKCFDCGKIGHFASKCPYAKKLDTNNDDAPKNNKMKNWKTNKGKLFQKKRNLYTEEDSESSSEEDNGESDDEEMLFFGFEKLNQQDDEQYEEGAEVNLEGELISALDDLQNERRRNRKLMKEVDQLERRIQQFISKSEVAMHTILELKKQVEEAHVVREVLKTNEEENKKLKTEVAITK